MQRRVVDLQKVTEERRALYLDKSEVKRQITCKKPCREEGYFTCTKLRWKGKSLAEIIEGGRTLVQNWGNAVDCGLPAAIHSERKDQSYQRCAWHRQETSSLSSTLEVWKSKQNNTHQTASPTDQLLSEPLEGSLCPSFKMYMMLCQYLSPSICHCHWLYFVLASQLWPHPLFDVQH